MRDFRERVSTFTLDFPVIGSSNSGETKGKVDPHCKSYTWVPVLWTCSNSRRYGFSPTLVILWLRAILMVRDVRWPEWSFIRFQNLD